MSQFPTRKSLFSWCSKQITHLLSFREAILSFEHGVWFGFEALWCLWLILFIYLSCIVRRKILLFWFISKCGIVGVESKASLLLLSWEWNVGKKPLRFSLLDFNFQQAFVHVAGNICMDTQRRLSRTLNNALTIFRPFVDCGAALLAFLCLLAAKFIYRLFNWHILHGWSWLYFFTIRIFGRVTIIGTLLVLKREGVTTVLLKNWLH